jgi:hypothetical protein
VNAEAAEQADEAEQQQQDEVQQLDEVQQHQEQLTSTAAVPADEEAYAAAQPAEQHCAAEAGTDAACGDDYCAAEEAAYSPAVQYYSTAAGTEAAYATGHSEGGMSHK